MRRFTIFGLSLTLATFVTASGVHAATCARYASVKSWTAHMHVSYDRMARTPNYIEHASGSADYASTLLPSSIGVIAFNGYSQTWVGHATGGAQLTDEVTNADGSPLSHPDLLRGSGPLVAKPPLGLFGPEQFWINPQRCTYAFYTSAAINATHSRDGATVAGTDAHIEEIPIPAASRTLSGSKTLALPNATNYMGGDQFHFPCRLQDWCNRKAGPGSATISWSFVPGNLAAATPAPEKTLRCPRADSNTGSAVDRTRQAISDAFKARGDFLPLRDVSVVESGGIKKIQIRIGADGRALPSAECVDEGIANGSATAQKGAHRMILGAVQQAANQTRVTLREIDVATGAILRTGLGVAPGTGAASVEQAAASALGQLGVQI